MYIKSSRIYLEDGLFDGIIEIEDGKIINFLDRDSDVKVEYDFKDHRVLPGIIDTHNHGTLGYNLMDLNKDNTINVIKGYLKGLASQGVTGIFPTTDNPDVYSIIADIADTYNDGAKILGIHSEGPYLNRVGEKGIDTGHPDIDLDYVQKMIDEAKGKLKLVALAIELPKAYKATQKFIENNVHVAFAHSNAMYDEAMKAFNEWGISVSTHTANVMSGIHHRDMGGLGACLLNDDLYNEVICDGKHISNVMLEVMFRIKRDPYNKFIMVSDSAGISGAPVGKYKLADDFPEVNVTSDGYCLSDTGRLCGSTMPVIKGIKNLVENVGIGMKYVLKMSSLNAAKLYGYPNKGSISIGKDADIIVIDDNYDCLYTFVEGHKVYNHNIDKDLFNKEFLAKHKI